MDLSYAFRMEQVVLKETVGEIVKTYILFFLSQFERFRRIFHHSTYRVLLCHTERQILSSLYLDEVWSIFGTPTRIPTFVISFGVLILSRKLWGKRNDHELMKQTLYMSVQHCFKQRVGIIGARPGEEEIFELTLVQVCLLKGFSPHHGWFWDSLLHEPSWLFHTRSIILKSGSKFIGETLRFFQL